MAEDINDQLIEKIKGVEFGLQLDEATDNNKDAHLICYVRFIDGNNIKEDLLFCKNITAGAKAQDLFEILDTFISENNLNWHKCVGVCTDGARSMSGCYGGLQALIRSKSPNALWTHCIIHREALASKHLSPALNQVLECVVNVVNFIKSRPPKARFLKNCVRIWEPNTRLCCIIAVHDSFLVVMFYHVPLNCGKNVLFFLQKKGTKMQNILLMPFL